MKVVRSVMFASIFLGIPIFGMRIDLGQVVAATVSWVKTFDVVATPDAAVNELIKRTQQALSGQQLIGLRQLSGLDLSEAEMAKKNCQRVVQTLAVAKPFVDDPLLSVGAIKMAHLPLQSKLPTALNDVLALVIAFVESFPEHVRSVVALLKNYLYEGPFSVQAVFASLAAMTPEQLRKTDLEVSMKVLNVAGEKIAQQLRALGRDDRRSQDIKKIIETLRGFSVDTVLSDFTRARLAVQ